MDQFEAFVVELERHERYARKPATGVRVVLHKARGSGIAAVTEYDRCFTRQIQRPGYGAALRDDYVDIRGQKLPKEEWQSAALPTGPACFENHVAAFHPAKFLHGGLERIELRWLPIS